MQRYLRRFDLQNNDNKKGVIYLDGCKIEPTHEKKKYGFRTVHQSPSYIPQCFTCHDKADFDQWMDHLKHFKK